MRAVVLVAICLTVALALLGGCATTPLPAGRITGKNMPDRLYCTQENNTHRCLVYRSAQPSPMQFVALRDQLGLKSDLKLNPTIEANDVVPAGVTFIYRPMSSVLVPKSEDVDATCAALEAAPKPLLVHCSAGRERTGYIIERCLRMRQQGIKPSPRTMYMEWLAFGMRTVLAPGLIEAFEHDTGWHP